MKIHNILYNVIMMVTNLIGLMKGDDGKCHICGSRYVDLECGELYGCSDPSCYMWGIDGYPAEPFEGYN